MTLLQPSSSSQDKPGQAMPAHIDVVEEGATVRVIDKVGVASASKCDTFSEGLYGRTVQYQCPRMSVRLPACLASCVVRYNYSRDPAKPQARTQPCTTRHATIRLDGDDDETLEKK